MANILFRETKSYKYLGYIINDNLCNEADITANKGTLVVGALFLLRKGYFSSKNVTNKCSLWAKCLLCSISLYHTLMHS